MSNIMNISSITNDNFITDIMQNVTIPNSTNDSTLKMSMNSTTTITTTTNNWLEFTSKIIAYYTPFIIFTGTIGNVLSILVFFRTKLKKLSSSYYLAALGASDTGYLFLNFLQWINVLGINIYNRELLCQLFTFLSNMFCMLSVWFVVAFTVERFIAVLYPLKRQTMCTVRRAKSILICLIIIGILHSSPLLLFAKATERRPGFMVCDIRPAFKVKTKTTKTRTNKFSKTQHKTQYNTIYIKIYFIITHFLFLHLHSKKNKILAPFSSFY